MSEVIKILEAPDLSFKSKNEVYDFLAKNESKIIQAKKGVIHESAYKFKNDSLAFSTKHLMINKIESLKGEIEFKEDFYYPIINTTNVVDSHGDVHLNGIWKKSAKEKNRKTYYVFDHELKSLSIIVKARDVEIKVIKTTFKALGYDMDGETEALTFVFNKDSVIHEKAEDFLNDEEMQNSVRMRYIDVVLCMNSDKTEHKEYKKNYEKYIGEVSNKEDLNELEYFYAVKEAEIVSEGSLVPLGSNRFTPIKYFKSKNIEPSQDTQETEPSQDTQKEKVRIFVKF